MSIKFDKNEVKNVWLEVRDRDEQDFTIGAGTYVVLREGASVQAPRSYAIDNHRVYGLVDSGASGFESGITYEVRFSIVIENELYIESVWIEVK